MTGIQDVKEYLHERKHIKDVLGDENRSFW